MSRPRPLSQNVLSSSFCLKADFTDLRLSNQINFLILNSCKGNSDRMSN